MFLWEFTDFNFSSSVYLTLRSSHDDIFELPIDSMYLVQPNSHCWHPVWVVFVFLISRPTVFNVKLSCSILGKLVYIILSV